MSSTDYVIGLGSNLGARLPNLLSACAGLRELGRIVAVSSLYETRALGPAQGDFLNAAVRISTARAPGALLDDLLGVEQRLGRVRRERWGPRTIDLDILWSPGLVLASSTLEIPHRELHNRVFALLPLLDVAPEACDPKTLQPYRKFLERLPQSDARGIQGGELGNWAAPVLAQG
ncbi:MAG TPA: 2-amino-4-hydroxy-6-hydroxymethyldihydropteridine diphosphokinase [Polyangiaceae bacterium]